MLCWPSRTKGLKTKRESISRKKEGEALFHRVVVKPHQRHYWLSPLNFIIFFIISGVMIELPIVLTRYLCSQNTKLNISFLIVSDKDVECYKK